MGEPKLLVGVVQFKRFFKGVDVDFLIGVGERDRQVGINFIYPTARRGASEQPFISSPLEGKSGEGELKTSCPEEVGLG